MATNKITVSILSEREKLFEGDVSCLLVPSKKGEVAILPYHTPLILLMVKGEISIIESGRHRQITTIEKGVLRVDENRAFALVNL